MKFYPDNNLYNLYNKYNIYSWLSPRMRDHTAKRSIDLLNYAINSCEKWDTFLDVGAGSGRISIPLLYKFVQGHAVEVSKCQELDSVAKEYKRLKVHYGLLQKFKAKEEIDFIALFDVFEHIPTDDVDSVLESLGKLQKKGGVIFILTPNSIHCGPAQESGIYYKRHPYGHHKQYCRMELESIFEKHDYRPVFYSYLDTGFTLLLRKFCLFFSVNDKKLLRIPGYRFISTPFIFLIDLMFHFLSLGSFQIELRSRFDDLSTRSIVIAFKKFG